MGNDRKKALLWVETGGASGHLNTMLEIAYILKNNNIDSTIASSEFCGKEDVLKSKDIGLLALPNIDSNNKPFPSHTFSQRLNDRINNLAEFYKKEKPDIIIVERFPIFINSCYSEEITNLTRLAKQNPKTITYQCLPDNAVVEGEFAQNISGGISTKLKKFEVVDKIYNFSKKIFGKSLMIRMKNKVLSSVGDTNIVDFIKSNYNGGMFKLGSSEMPLGKEHSDITALRNQGIVTDVGYFKPEDSGKNRKYDSGGPIIVTVGGGQSKIGDLVLEKILEARKFLPEELKGKEMYLFVPHSSDRFDSLKEKANNLPDPEKIHVQRTNNDMKTLLPKASFVITLGGITLSEAASFGIPSVCCPFEKHKEQLWRGKAFEDAGMTKVLNKEEISDPEKFAKHIGNEFKRSAQVMEASVAHSNIFDAASIILKKIKHDLAQKKPSFSLLPESSISRKTPWVMRTKGFGKDFGIDL